MAAPSQINEFDSQGQVDKLEPKICECGEPMQQQYVEPLERWITLGCPACDAERKQAQEREKARQQNAERVQMFERIIPPLFHSARLDDLSEQLKNEILLKSFNQGLLLWGGVGVGKTHAMAAYTYELIQRDYSVQRITFKELLLSIRETYEGKRTEAAVYRPLINTDVLIVEDVATAKASEFATDTLLYIVDKRLELSCPTLITSNLSPENLEKLFGQRIGSRIWMFKILKIGGQDKRKITKNEIKNDRRLN